MSLKLDLKIFLFLFLFLITSQIHIYIIIMIFAIIHELGHLFVGLLLKFKIKEVRLTPMGLRMEFKADNNKYYKKIKRGNILNIKKAIIALAGPVINFLIAFILIILKKDNTYLYNLIIYSNLLIAFFNLIPIYPMDGGRFINEILKINIGYIKAYKITYILSKTILVILTIISSIAILYLKNIAIILIMLYLWFLELQEIRRYNKRKNIEKMVGNIENNKHNMV